MTDQDILSQSDKLQIASLTEENRMLNVKIGTYKTKESDVFCRLLSVSGLLKLLADANGDLIEPDNELLVAAKDLVELIAGSIEYDG